MNKLRHFLKTLMLILFPIILASCSSAPPVTGVDVHVSSIENTNQGKVVYVLFRHVSRKAFALEPYDYVTTKAFASNEDKSYISQELIIPGQDKSFTVDDKNMDMAVYVFFTKPGKFWKAYLPYSSSNDNWYIDLNEKEIESIEKDSWFFSFF